MQHDKSDGDAFEIGLFLPARRVASYPDILTGFATDESLKPYLDNPGEHRHIDADRHLLDEEAKRLDAERQARDIARHHAIRSETSMFAMVNTAVPLGHRGTFTAGQDYLLQVARDERTRLGEPTVDDLSRASAAMREVIRAK